VVHLAAYVDSSTLTSTGVSEAVSLALGLACLLQ
jgi:hypothetical protein